MKNINWKNVATTALIATLACVFLAPFARPILRRIPVVGNWVG